MPLDSSGVTPIFAKRIAGQGEAPTLDYGPDIGVALRAAREWRGLTIDDVAEDTRIRRAYIAAIEDMRLDQLPSRPFTIGYIKSYAELMGFEPGAAIARFKEASPDPDTGLREPIGVPQERDPRLGMIGMAGAVILASIITWNVAQRAINADAPPATPDIEAIAPTTPTGPVSLGAPLPAPTESTTPQLYLTPGLEAPAIAAFDLTKPGVVPMMEGQTPSALPMPPTFVPRGAIYGAQPNVSVVTLQARKPALLVIRSADGAVYYARQLQAGEAYRAPIVKGLTFEAADPGAFDVYVQGKAQGQLTSSQVVQDSFFAPAPAQTATR